MDDCRIYFATYNVGTAVPEESLLELLSLSSNPKNDKVAPDFYVIGLQEVSAQPHHLLFDAFSEDPWTRALKEILSTRNYIKIKTIRLQGLVLSVFALRRHLLNIREVESSYTRTGLSGMWGNKGAVSIRLGIYGCTVCFVNAHLSAHDDKLDDRIDDYNSIVKDQDFHVEETKAIFFHDYVFWMGDLNFRILEEYDKSPEEIEKMIEKGDLDTLFKYDQLRYVMNKREAFTELHENNPTFPPTFKFEVGESKYDYKRRPAWTDRILYTVHTDNYENVKLQAEQKSYMCHPKYLMSDHKPVTAEFVIKVPEPVCITKSLPDSQVFSDYGEEIVKFDKIEHWFENEENTVTYEFTKQCSVNRNDWIGVYKADFCCLDEYESYEYVYKNASPSATPTPTHRALLNPGTVASNSHHLANKYDITYTITFSQPSGEKEGLYRLIYISDNENKVRSVLGVSEPFQIKSKED